MTATRRFLPIGVGHKRLVAVLRQEGPAGGQSPAKAVENLRVEAARLAIEDGRHTIDEIAGMTGFGDPERMRRAFLRTLGQPPQVLRRNARLANALAAE
jgi:transcriptional regulator GlxA family with amidase domain